MVSWIFYKEKLMEYYFCSSKVRPNKCILKTNLCCLICQHNEQCYYSTRNGILPCRIQEDELDDCELKI